MKNHAVDAYIAKSAGLRAADPEARARADAQGQPQHRGNDEVGRAAASSTEAVSTRTWRPRRQDTRRVRILEPSLPLKESTARRGERCFRRVASARHGRAGSCGRLSRPSAGRARGTHDQDCRCPQRDGHSACARAEERQAAAESSRRTSSRRSRRRRRRTLTPEGFTPGRRHKDRRMAHRCEAGARGERRLATAIDGLPRASSSTGNTRTADAMTHRMQESPVAVVLAPVTPALASVIWLHGLGADGRRLRADRSRPEPARFILVCASCFRTRACGR